MTDTDTAVAQLPTRTVGVNPDSTAEAQAQAAADNDDTADDVHIISGLALGVGDITHGLSGNLKVWKEEHLKAAASTLVGAEIKPLHSEQAVGEVTNAGFVPDRGVLYEAELRDPKLAQGIDNDRLTVSIEGSHAIGGQEDTPRGTALVPTNITFEALAIVQNGAAPSASAQSGEAVALAPATVSVALAQHSSQDGAEGGSAAALASVSQGDRVSWNYSGGTGHGRVSKVHDGEGTVERTIEGSTVTRDSDEAPVAEIENWDDSAEEFSGTVLKYVRNLSSWDAPSAAMAETEGTGTDPGGSGGDNSDSSGDDTPQGTSDDASTAEGSAQRDSDSDSVDTDSDADGNADGSANGSANADTSETQDSHMSDGDSNSPDDDNDVAELKAKLQDKTSRIDELETEVAELEDEKEALSEKAEAVDTAKTAYAEALAEHVPREADALMDDMSLRLMREWLADIEDASVADAAAPDPDGDADGQSQDNNGSAAAANNGNDDSQGQGQGRPDPTVQSGSQEGSAGSGQAQMNLSERDRERLADLKARKERLEGRDSLLAENELETVTEQIAELTGEAA